MVDTPYTALLMGGKNSITDAHMACWTGLCDLFFARRDRLGRRLPDVISDTSGKPVVGPWRWKNQAYNRMDYQGLNTNVIAQHISGTLTDDFHDRVQFQTYAADPTGTSVWTAIDLDVKGEAHADVGEHFDTQALAREASRKLIAETESLGLTAHLEVTKSAGDRVWIFHERCPWNQARDLGRLLVQRAGLHPKTEVFPVSAPANKDALGSAVLVPFWGGNAKQGRQVMIDPMTERVREVSEFALHALAHRTPADRLAQIVTAAAEAGEIKQTAAKRERRERTDQDGDGALAQGAEVADPCWQAQLAGCGALRDMAQRSEDGSELSRAEWMRLATHLKQYGDWGLAEFHRLSSYDSRYMEHETDMMFDSLQYGPTNCDKMECGHNPQADCGMAECRVNSSSFAYRARKQLPMVSTIKARRLHQPAPTDNAEEGLLTPWSPDLCVPDEASPWSIRDGGVWHTKETRNGPEFTRVIGQIVQIVERARDLDDGGEHIVLRWSEVGPWKEATVPRRTVSDTHAILSLADQGLAVNSVNARQVVSYLAHLLDIHQAAIPVARVVSSCGHKRIDGKDVFVMGGTVIGDEDVQVSIAPQADPNGVLKALGPDPQWEDARARVDRWVALAERLGAYPVAAFGVGAGLLSIILADLRLIQNPVVDFGGRSSSGKSTLLRFIASAWGLAPEIMGGQVRSWSSTPVYVERIASLCNDLPIFLDESHNARPEMVQNIVYQYANGTGKGRGTKDGGVQTVSRYRGVLFSAGEARLADVSAHDGVQGRVLGFWGSPFGEGQAELVAEINDVAASCYGLVGPGVAAQYVNRREYHRPHIQAWQAAAFQRLRTRVSDGMGERLAAVCAAVEAACRLACEIMDLTWDVTAVVDAAFARLTETRKADSAQSSLELVGAWAAGRMEAFAGKTWSSLDAREVLGLAFEDGDGSQRLAILPEAVKRVLEQHKYPYHATLSHWKDRGWLETDKESGQSRSTKKMRLQGRAVGLIALSPAGMRIAMGLDGGDDLVDAALEMPSNFGVNVEGMKASPTT